jgi:hypothetical protein
MKLSSASVDRDKQLVNVLHVLRSVRVAKLLTEQFFGNQKQMTDAMKLVDLVQDPDASKTSTNHGISCMR